MSPILRKLLIVLLAIAIAAGITYLPWVIVFRLPDSVSTFWGMTAILWAPLALVIGIIIGCVFAYFSWPKKLEY